MRSIFNEKVPRHCSQLTLSNSAAGTKKKKRTKHGSTKRRRVNAESKQALCVFFFFFYVLTLIIYVHVPVMWVTLVTFNRRLTHASIWLKCEV